MTIHTYRDAGELASYHTDHLSRSGDTVETPSMWFGQGAELLSLLQLDQLKSFRRLCKNKHPKTGKRLTCRHSPQARPAYDLTFSAPK